MALITATASGVFRTLTSCAAGLESLLCTPSEKLVKVFDSEQESEVLVVKGLLDSVGIESDMTSVEAVQDLFPGVGGTVLLVREEDAALAKQTIEESRNAVVDDETAEISGEPGAKA